MLKLSSNNKLNSLPDSPEHHLRRVLCSLHKTQKTSDYNATYQYAVGLTANNENDVKSLLLKHIDIIKSFQWLYQIPSFHNVDFSPKDLVQAKRTIWGVVEPFVHGGIVQLSFLGSSIPEDLMAQLNGDRVAGANRRLCQTLEESHYPIHHTVSLWYLAKIAEDAYHAHLHPLIGYFGQRSPVWVDSFETYKNALRKRMASDKAKMGSEAGIRLDEIMMKTNLIFDKNVILGITCMPKMDGLVPLLCPTFLQDLMKVLFNVEPVLELVSFLNSLRSFQA